MDCGTVDPQHAYTKVTVVILTVCVSVSYYHATCYVHVPCVCVEYKAL